MDVLLDAGYSRDAAGHILADWRFKQDDVFYAIEFGGNETN